MMDRNETITSETPNGETAAVLPSFLNLLPHHHQNVPGGETVCNESRLSRGVRSASDGANEVSVGPQRTSASRISFETRFESCLLSTMFAVISECVRATSCDVLPALVH